MKAKSSDRQERLARALRANLKRRKARARALPKDAETRPSSSPGSRPIVAKKAD